MRVRRQRGWPHDERTQSDKYVCETECDRVALPASTEEERKLVHYVEKGNTADHTQRQYHRKRRIPQWGRRDGDRGSRDGGQKIGSDGR